LGAGRAAGRVPVRDHLWLVYWGEQHIPSGLTAVLFGILPLYTALLGALLLHDQPLRARLLGGVAIAIGGLALAFSESLDLGSDDLAAAGALAVVISPLGASIGNISTKRREGGRLDAVAVNGWGMLAGGLLLLAASALSESWGEFAWSAESAGSIAYLAVLGSAVPFVGLMVLLRHLTAQAISYIALLIPFGALGLGALIESEPLTAQAITGAALVGAGLLVAQARRGSSELAAADHREEAPHGALGLAAPAAGERAIAEP
jgi:drug/metabolite transporter (DMT)-like permease